LFLRFLKILVLRGLLPVLFSFSSASPTQIACYTACCIVGFVFWLGGWVLLAMVCREKSVKMIGI